MTPLCLTHYLAEVAFLRDQRDALAVSCSELECRVKELESERECKPDILQSRRRLLKVNHDLALRVENLERQPRDVAEIERLRAELFVLRGTPVARLTEELEEARSMLAGHHDVTYPVRLGVAERLYVYERERANSLDCRLEQQGAYNRHVCARHLGELEDIERYRKIDAEHMVSVSDKLEETTHRYEELENRYEQLEDCNMELVDRVQGLEREVNISERRHEFLAGRLEAALQREEALLDAVGQ